MDETLTESSNPETEIENLLADQTSPEGIKPWTRLEDSRKVDNGITVMLLIQEGPKEPRSRNLYIAHPPDELGRWISESYDLTNRQYKEIRNPAFHDSVSAQQLADRDMTAEDDAKVQDWIEKFKAAPAGEVVDDKKGE